MKIQESLALRKHGFKPLYSEGNGDSLITLWENNGWFALSTNGFPVCEGECLAGDKEISRLRSSLKKEDEKRERVERIVLSIMGIRAKS